MNDIFLIKPEDFVNEVEKFSKSNNAPAEYSQGLQKGVILIWTKN
ncbi:MAG: hypothetical protein ACYCVH_06345 [Ignavibacteriaceae bacterium]